MIESLQTTKLWNSIMTADQLCPSLLQLLEDVKTSETRIGLRRQEKC